MKNMKKKHIIILTLAILSGLVAASVAFVVYNHANSQKSSYNTAGLSEKKVGKVKFYTSKTNDWKDHVSDKTTVVYMLDSKNSSSISIVSSTDGTNSKEWDKLNQDTIKKELGNNVKNAEVKNVETNGKKMYKLTYDLAQVQCERYYINLDGKHTAIVTYTKKQGNDIYQKEIENVINTIEYVN